jgi:hexosaminidase
VKGVTGAIWTEYVQTGQRLEYTLLPRMLALSEIAWAPLERKDYRRFTEQQLPRQLAKLETKGYEFRVPVAVGMVDTIMQGARFTVALTPSVEGARIHYTIDGYPASETDAVYTAPLTFEIPSGQQRELQTVVVTPSNRKSTVTRTVMYNRPQPENNRFNTVRALVYRVIKGPVADLAAVERGESVDSDTATTFDLSRFRDRGPSFGVSYEGAVVLDVDGTYTFELASAGPSRLWIDDRLVVDNPGGASETVRTGQTTILRGLHRIRVLYAQQAPGRLGVAMTSPGGDKTELRGPIFRSFVLGKDQTGIDAQ